MDASPAAKSCWPCTSTWPTTGVRQKSTSATKGLSRLPTESEWRLAFPETSGVGTTTTRVPKFLTLSVQRLFCVMRHPMLREAQQQAVDRLQNRSLDVVAALFRQYPEGRSGRRL